MTCIAGIAINSHVYVGGDSAGFQGQTVHLSATGKVFRNGEFIIGCAGSRRVNDLVRYTLSLPPLPPETNMDVYMATNFAASLRECLRTGGHLDVDFSTRESQDAMMIVGVRGNLYLIDSDFAAVRAKEGFSAVGSGAEVALGALHVTENLEPEKRVIAALEAAERWTDSVRGPFVIESI